MFGNSPLNWAKYECVFCVDFGHSTMFVLLFLSLSCSLGAGVFHCRRVLTGSKKWREYLNGLKVFQEEKLPN